MSTFDRPNDATPYSAGDAVYDDTTGGVIGFTDMGASGTLENVSLGMSDTATADFDLLVFEQEPTNFADNAPVSLGVSDLDKLIGVFSFADAGKIALGGGRQLYKATDQNRLAYTSDGGQLYGILVTRSGFTPSAGTVFSLALHARFDP